MKNIKLLLVSILIFLMLPKVNAQNCEADFFSVQDTMNTVHFVDQSEASDNFICTYNWGFGDGNTSSESNPTHIYNSDGQYEVCLVIQTALDVNCEEINCIDTTCYMVSVEAFVPCDLNISYSITNASSSLASDGAIDLTVNGGIAPYFYFWNNGQTVEDLSGIPAGEYSILVSDFAGCTDTLFFRVGVNMICNLYFNYYTVNPTYTGDSDGSINLSVSGGMQPYNFIWSNGETTEGISGLEEGEYLVIVTDFLGCEDSMTFLLEDSLSCNMSLSSIDVDASEFGASDGSIDLTVTGGTQPMNYIWSNGAVTEDLSGITAGEYMVIVNDFFGCVDSLKIFINEPLPCNMNLSYSQINPSQFGASDGSIDLTVSGGTQPFIYLWSNGVATEDMEHLEAGEYTVVVLDANQCEETTIVTLVNPIEEIYSLSGQVYAKENLLPEGVALLINNEHKAIAITDIVSGEFLFLDMDSGIYSVYTVPYFDLNYEYYPIYFPTYSGDERNWIQAESILVDSIRETTIHLDYFEGIVHGPGYIEGKVEYETNSAAGSEIFQQAWFSNFRAINAVKASNITVFLINENHQVFDFCLSDANGEYSFNKLPFGTYTIHAEQVGKLMQMVSVNLNQEKDSLMDVNLIIQSDEIISVPEIKPDVLEVNISPNPFSEFININFQNIETKNLVVSISDILGREVLKVPLSKEQTYLLTSSLENGIYVMVVKTGGKVVFKDKLIKR